MTPTTPTARTAAPSSTPRKLTRWIAASSVVPTILLAGAGTAVAAPSGSFPGCPVLSEGNSSGPCVERLQVDLNTVNSGYHLTQDGVFGVGTRIAVLDFQGRNHLGADGIVGASTADELTRQSQAEGAVPTPSPSGVPADGPATAQPHMLTPDRAERAALGLIDSTGPLAFQGGLSRIGDFTANYTCH
jgi:peptidoglycan hydrolase-like protein with peptidoglycan-binding domain